MSKMAPIDDEEDLSNDNDNEWLIEMSLASANLWGKLMLPVVYNE
nr:9978_t:CDS:2 [Entrophospora candida]